jgi:hypothetical protein
MGALTPTIVPALVTGASVGLNLLQRSQELRATEAAARQSARNSAAQADLRLEDLRTQQAEEAAKRRDTLRCAQARAPASLAARGVGAGGGSGAAVLQGLAAETARDAAFAAEEFDLRAENIRLGLDTARERDLLRLSEQRRRAQLETLRQGLSLPARFDLI